MTLQDEALDYWKLCRKYRQASSMAWKTYIAHHAIPTLHMRATNPRIIIQLSTIMHQEGITNDEDQSQDPCA